MPTGGRRDHRPSCLLVRRYRAGISHNSERAVADNVSCISFCQDVDAGTVQRGQECFGVLGSDERQVGRQLCRIIVGERLSNGRIFLDFSGELSEHLFIDTFASSQHSHRAGKHGLHRPDIPLEEPASLGERPVNALIDAFFQVQVYDRKHAKSLPDVVDAPDALLYLGRVPGQIEIDQRPGSLKV